VAGEELAPEAFVVDLVSTGSDTAETAHPTLGTLRGFFIIEAASLEEIERIARESPHHAHRGRIVLRRVASGSAG
jgi:hypothetical protein